LSRLEAAPNSLSVPALKRMEPSRSSKVTERSGEVAWKAGSLVVS
jgi:hypothetical protein